VNLKQNLKKCAIFQSTACVQYSYDGGRVKMRTRWTGRDGTCDEIWQSPLEFVQKTYHTLVI